MVETSTTNKQTWTIPDEEAMDLALRQARSAAGRVAPNPAVGAVIVRDGEIIATGATQPPPGRHAETEALARAGEAARDADMYVTLEPCSHHGWTPPCTEAIIRAGIRRVIVGVSDPNPLVDGRGLAQLRDAGIVVETGCRADAAAEVIAGFASRIRTGRPQTIAKYAMTLDGRLSAYTGHSRWVTGPAARQNVHVLRDRIDAILVGIGTVLADDPQLTTRLPDELAGYGGPHQPLRVVLDGQLRTPPTARMLAAETPGETLIYTGDDAPEERQRTLEAAGAIVVRVSGPDGKVDPQAVLLDLGRRGINDLLIEGGSQVLGAFFDLGLVDRVHAYIAPVIVGGQHSPGPIGGRGVETMGAAWRLTGRRVTQFDDDILIEGRVVAGEGCDDV